MLLLQGTGDSSWFTLWEFFADEGMVNKRVFRAVPQHQCTPSNSIAMTFHSSSKEKGNGRFNTMDIVLSTP